MNFLVNEQPDRALEAFLRAVELDDDTIETHFALGSLYRRRGEVDRAIKIHQNIATRETLEPSQREQAGFALAQDYLKAGMLDRAEKILEPLAASGAHRMAAMRKLMRIYEQEQEWIAGHRRVPRTREGGAGAAGERDCALLLRAGRGGACAWRPGRGARAPARGAQGGAPLSARRAGPGGHRDRAGRLRAGRDACSAACCSTTPRSPSRSCRGSCASRARRAVPGSAAIQRVVESCPDAVNEVAIASIMADALDFAPLEERVRACLAQDDAIAGLVRAIGRDPAALDARAVVDIATVLRRLAARTPRYRCANCGFSSIDHFWQCPGCKTWDSQRPLLRFDLVAGLEGGAK